MRSTPRELVAVAVGVGVALWPAVGRAHVKWFSAFDFEDRPRSLAEVATPTFWGLTALSMIALGVLVVLDRSLAGTGWYRRAEAWLEARQGRADAFLRAGTAATLLLSFQAGTLLAPELSTPASWVGWVEFGLAVLLMFDAALPVVGAGLVLLYGIGVAAFGALHMLDYVLVLGVGAYFLVSRSGTPWLREAALPALYLGLGFSLCWVACEKLVYPQWGLYVLQQNPQLAMGLDLRFFLVGAAFVELGLGYLMLLGLLQRPLSVVVTLVFFTTTLVFGKTEVVGHTLIHAILIVFLLQGPGRFYAAPYQLHRRLPLRVAFASVNFAVVLTAVLVPYATLAASAHAEAQAARVSPGRTPSTPAQPGRWATR